MDELNFQVRADSGQVGNGEVTAVSLYSVAGKPHTGQSGSALRQKTFRGPFLVGFPDALIRLVNSGPR